MKPKPRHRPKTVTAQTMPSTEKVPRKTIVAGKVFYHYTDEYREGDDPIVEIIEIKPLYTKSPVEQFNEFKRNPLRYIKEFKPNFIVRITAVRKSRKPIVIYSEPYLPESYRALAEFHLMNLDREILTGGIPHRDQDIRDFVGSIIVNYLISLLQQGVGGGLIEIPVPKEAYEKYPKDHFKVPFLLYLLYVLIQKREYHMSIAPILLDEDIEDATNVGEYDPVETRVKNAYIRIIFPLTGQWTDTNIEFPGTGDTLAVLNLEFQEFLTRLGTDLTVNRQHIVTSYKNLRIVIESNVITGVKAVPKITIRRLAGRRIISLFEYARKSSRFYLDDNHFFIAYMLLSRAIPNLMAIVGPSGSGKTTLLRSYLATSTTSERIIVLEEVEEIILPRKLTWDKMIISDVFTWRDALDIVRRKRPDLVVVGELVSKDQFDTMINLTYMGSTGLTTFHAHDPDSYLARLTTFYQLSQLKQLLMLHPTTIYMNTFVEETLKRRITGVTEFTWNEEKNRPDWSYVFTGNIRTGRIEPRDPKKIYERSYRLQSLTEPTVMGLDESEVILLLEKLAYLSERVSPLGLPVDDIIEILTITKPQLFQTTLSEYREVVNDAIEMVMRGESGEGMEKKEVEEGAEEEEEEILSEGAEG